MWKDVEGRGAGPQYPLDVVGAGVPPLAGPYGEPVQAASARQMRTSAIAASSQGRANLIESSFPRTV